MAMLPGGDPPVRAEIVHSGLTRGRSLPAGRDRLPVPVMASWNFAL